MFNISTTALKSANPGTAWKADGMKGYMAVVGRVSSVTANDTVTYMAGTITLGTSSPTLGSVSVDVGDTLIAFQPATSNAKCYLFVLKSETGQFVGGNLQSSLDAAAVYNAIHNPSNTSSTTLSLTISADSSSAISSSQLELTGELLGYLCDGQWSRGTIAQFETMKSATTEW